MSTAGMRAVDHLRERRGRLHVYWLTVAFFAIVIAFGDGFWVTSVQGAVGAIERNDPPLGRWLRDSTLMLPLFFLAVVAALMLARRWFGHSRRRFVKFGGTALLLMLITSAVGITEVAASSAYDYRLQTRDLTSVVAFHHHEDTVAPAAATTGGCKALCAEKRLTMKTHLKALRLASVVLLLSNVVLVLWLLALRGDRLWRSNAPPTRAPADGAVSHGVAGAVFS
jgi:hypothetical protein